MNKDFMRKWIVALRSKKFKQGKNYLNDDANYCCLGVACELLDLKKGVSITGQITYNGCAQSLPSEARDIIGISHQGSFNIKKISPKIAEIIDDSNESCLSHVNDRGFDFKFIANLIEDIEENDAWLY